MHPGNCLDTKTFREPRWPIACVILAVGVLPVVLPESYSFGPRWILPALVIALELPALLAHHRGAAIAAWRLGLAASCVITLSLLASVALLITGAIHHTREPVELLRSGSLLWLSNILVFATWYWRLDAGGPLGRERLPGHHRGAFLFPQMTLQPHHIPDHTAARPWSPNFIDYLFLAFNTSTAFSPTDVPVLSRWAKALCMLQSLLSLSILAVLIARAVNAL